MATDGRRVQLERMRHMACKAARHVLRTPRQARSASSLVLISRLAEAQPPRLLFPSSPPPPLPRTLAEVEAMALSARLLLLALALGNVIFAYSFT